MTTKKQSIDELIVTMDNYLNSLSRSRYTLRDYRRIWERLKVFMSDQKLKYFDQSVSDLYLKSVLGDYDYSRISQFERRVVNIVGSLHIFQITGEVHWGPSLIRRKPKQLAGEIGLAMETFLTYKKTSFKLAITTMRGHTKFLHDLLMFLTAKKITSMSEIKEVHILSFVKSLDPKKLSVNHSTLGVVKSFLRYAFEEQLIGKDYSNIIQRVNYKSQPQLPSVFSVEEIKCLLNSIDRANPSGKRDFAMILLGAKLGMRASDIAALKFENINWNGRVIECSQVKTGKQITLPLLPEIGNAIVDYLKYARPVSTESHCFLQALAPFKKVTSGDISRVTRFHMNRAGIDTNNRRHGSHALRHSFAANLLTNKTVLPIISEALGHSHTNSTMYYLRIDKRQLQQCALEVPIVPFSFYNQKGGFAL